MDKEARNIFEMTNGEAQIIIGNMPVYPDDCYSIAEYQWAKSMAIKALGQQPFINKPCVSEGVCREDKMRVLDKIRDEIDLDTRISVKHYTTSDAIIDTILDIIDKYREDGVE